MPKRTILIGDDDPGIRFAVSDYLSLKGFDVQVAACCAEVEEAFRPRSPDAAVLDYQMPDGDAIELLPRLRALDPDVPIVILSGQGTIDAAVRAIKEGAANFLTKPIELDALLVVVTRLLTERSRKNLQNAERRARAVVNPFAGTSEVIRQLEEDARRVVDSDRPVLIQGETGTGKGTLAKWLYHNGPRSDEAFLSINCAGLSQSLLESELFGHERGAFTGAVTAKRGLLEAAHRGVLLLDEVGDMEVSIQPKLLTVLEEQRFLRLGSVHERHVDIRLIAATHQDLKQLAREGKFRSDLYFRISTLPLAVPALRDRTEDIPILAEQLIAGLGTELGRRELRLSPDAVDRLQAHSWPGNIRELRNVLERAALLSDRDELTPRELRFEVDLAPDAETASSPGMPMTLAEIERAHIVSVLDQCDSHVGSAADVLGIPRSTLYTKLRKLGIE